MNAAISTLDELLADDDTAVVPAGDYDPDLEQAAAELRYYLAQTGAGGSTLEQLHNARLSLIQRRQQLRLLTPSMPTASAAWQTLAPGFTVSRLHQAAQEWRGYFSDKALLNRVFLQLGDDGLAMSLQLAGFSGDASPSTWTLKLSLLTARGSAGKANELAGAMLIEATQADSPLVLFAPGRPCEFFQYDSREALAQGIDALLGLEASLEFVALEADQDIFELSVAACLVDPLELPLTDLPASWQSVIDHELDSDSDIYSGLISFGSLSASVPLRQRERKVADYLQKIEALVEKAAGADQDQLESQSPLPYRNARRALAQTIKQNNVLIDTLAKQTLPLAADFWSSRYESLVLRRQEALLEEVKLQRIEGWLSEAEAERILLHVTVPPQTDAETLVLTLSLQMADHSVPVQGALVFTTRAALVSASDSALLFMPGVGGGLQRFSSLAALKQDLLFSLSCGLDTPIWQLISPADRQAVSGEGMQVLVTELATSAVRHSVQSQLTGATAAATAAHAGERFFADADSNDLTLERLRNEWAETLGLAPNEARERASDQFAGQQLSARLSAKLPSWLLNATTEVREQYAQQVLEYQAFARALETHLDRVLPDFEAFVITRVKQQLLKDLGVDIDTASVIVDLPQSASYELVPDENVALPVNNYRWVVSKERVPFSLHALCAQNFDAQDPQTRERFRAVKVTAPQLDATQLQTLSGDYLLKVVTSLNVAEHYRALLKQVFKAPAAEAADYGLSTEVLLKPYEASILLEGFAACQLKRLSPDGYRLLETAARARSMDDLRVPGIEMYWVVCNPGASSMGERQSQTVDGACVIHQPTSNTTIIYLPAAPQDCSFIEANGLAEAKQRMIAQLYGQPALIKHISVLAGLGVEDMGLSLYIDRALSNRFDGFIDFQPALHLRISAQQLHTREWRLYQQNVAVSRSNHDIERAQGMQDYERFLMYFKAALSFIPGLSVVFSTRDVWESSHAANLAFSEGRTGEGVMASVSVGLSLVDVLLTALPGAAILGAMAKAMRATARLRQVSSGLAALPKLSRGSLLVPFDGYQRPVSLSDALAQGGRDLGTWRKDGELWIWRQGEAYQVYRRSGEQTLRLRKSLAQGYEPPVRLENGEWVYHSDVGLKGGVKSTRAANMMSRANPDPEFGPPQARQLLDEFEFPALHECAMEGAFATEYRLNLRVPRWAETYRRHARGYGPAPAPGSSSGGLLRRPAPAVTVVLPKRSRRDNVATVSAPRHTAGSDAWKGWGYELDENTVLDIVMAQPPVMRVIGTRQDVARIDGVFFDVLPPGSQAHSSIMFLKSPELRGTSFKDLNRVLSRDRHLQPVVATHAEGHWRVHGGLFRRKLEDMLAEYRPGYTPGTSSLLAERLFELADDSLPVINGSRLINVRATFNAWKAGTPAPLPRLQDPLLLLEGARPSIGDARSNGPSVMGATLRIGNLNKLETLSRVDFTADLPPLSAPLNHVLVDPSDRYALRNLMEAVVRLQGYEVLNTEGLGNYSPGLLAFKRANQPQLYVMAVRRLSGSRIYVDVARRFPMSNAWLDELCTFASGTGMESLSTARDSRRVVKLVGGLNLLSNPDGGKQLFAVRIADDF